MINNRIKPQPPKLVQRDQKGFITEKKLEETVLKTTHLINYCIRENIPAYLLFIDQENAFDRVDHDYLYIIIEKINFPPLLQNLIKCIYKKILARISINNQLSDRIELHSGVRELDKAAHSLQRSLPSPSNLLQIWFEPINISNG